MNDTAVKCVECNSGMLLIDVNPDGDNTVGNSYIEQPCPRCAGRGILTKSELISMAPDKRLDADNFLPIPLTGALRVYLDGRIYDRKMSSRQLFVLAKKVLDVAIETQNFERERDADGTDNSGNAG